jgi:ribosomal protein S18 acetylase RimI-like enzyme
LLFIFAGASLTKFQQHKSRAWRCRAALDENALVEIEKASMTVRPATDCDRAALFDLHRAVFLGHIEKIWGWNESWQRSNFAAEFACAATSVIEADGQIVGYVQILDKEDRIYVQNIAVSQEFQGKGIGTRILKKLQLSAAARNVPLQLGVFRTNTLAQRLYERLGFRRTGETTTHIEMSWAAT